jgi:drug/metabolite transporter (DMT)-like permease
MKPALRLQLMFAFVCVVWGSTWIAMKTGTAQVPPGLFSGLRWVTAGTLLLIMVRVHEGALRVPWAMARRVVFVALLLVTTNQLLMLYALRYVGSGLGAVVNCALTPLSLLGFAVAMRQERITKRIVLAMALGVLGILLLFGPAAIAGRLDGTVLLGALGIIFGTLTYSAGSVLARPLMGTVSPLLLGGLINIVGGAFLLAFSIMFEPGALQALDLRWGWAPWISWLFLVGPAAIGASTIFLVLVRDWGATKSGSYAFVSPIIAVLLGLAISGEALHPFDAVGMALMLGGAWVALRKA